MNHATIPAVPLRAPLSALLLALLLGLLGLPTRAELELTALRLAASEVTLTFTAEAGARAEEFAIEASPDLGQSLWKEVPSLVQDLGAERWQATVTATATQMFFRVTRHGSAITAAFPSATATITEGANNSVAVDFSAPFTGTLNYSIQSPGELITGQIQVENSSRITIPVPLVDDTEVNPLEALTIRLEAANDGVSYRIGSGASQRLTFEDNDQFRTGILSSEDETLRLPIRILVTEQSGLSAAFLKSGTHGLVPPNPGHPDGDWIFSNFSLTGAALTGAVAVTVPAAETYYGADTELVITLDASGSENLADVFWTGAFTLASTVPSKPHLNVTRAGTFLLGKEPGTVAELPAPTSFNP